MSANSNTKSVSAAQAEATAAIQKAVDASTGETVTIREAALLVGKQELYIHQLVTKQKIAAVKELIPGRNVPRWMIDKAALLAYFSNGNRHTARADGRNKWVVYATKAELARVQALLVTDGMNEVAATIAPANDYEKMKAYQAKRKAAKADSGIKSQAAALIAEIKATHPGAKVDPLPTMPSKAVRAAAHASRK